jgi:hypothetical protein
MGINRNIPSIKNQGFIDSFKRGGCVRILGLNPRGFGVDSNEKIEMMKEAMSKYEIDVLLLSSPDRRWRASTRESLKRSFRQVNKSVEVLTSDSREDTRGKSDYLPGGTLSILTGISAGMVNKEEMRQNDLGNWNSFRIEGGGRKLQLINAYRIPDSTEEGIMKSRAQYDRVKGKLHSSQQYREMMLSELVDEIKRVQEDGVDGVLLSGDFNQDIGHQNMQRFLREAGMQEVHQVMNETEENVRDRTYKNGQNQIDAIFVTTSLIQYVRGSKIVDFDEVIPTDHRGFLIDIDFEEYFNIKPSTYDKSESRKLNPNNRRHREKFKEVLEQYIHQMGLLERAQRVCNDHATVRELNLLDDAITYVLSEARRQVEGIQRNVPYSKEKQQKASAPKYIKALLKVKRGGRVDEGALKRRKEFCGMDLEDLSIPALEDRLTGAIEEWEDFKKEALEKKEDKMLELYPVEISGDSDEAKKKRKKALRTIKQQQFRERTFNILSKGVGKGEKKALRAVREVGQDGTVIQEYQDRESIENAIARYNKDHFRQAYSSKAYKDKIYKKLCHDSVRNKILNGELEVEDCDDVDVYDMLKLLKRTNQNSHEDNWRDINELEWETVVRKSKRKSASSIFSQRTYSVYKCAIDSKIMTKILLLLYNTLFRKGWYLKRWKKVLDVILEKGKGPIIGKLRTIQLIEADLQLMMRIFIGLRNDTEIEKDTRLSKYNYGSRPGYSIDVALLEKRLMYDASVRNGQPTMHTLSDLKACYDRQLPALGCLIQEAVGVTRQATKVFADILPIMEHHICTNFGISKISYGSCVEPLGGTGQGNSVSGAICRDTSCFIFKYLEEKKLGAKLRAPISKEEFQRIAIAFVDDTDFYTNGVDFELKMQLIMEIYTRLYEATGGKIQQEKIMFYCWKWIYINGKQHIVQMEATIEVHEEIIKIIDVNQSTRTLGVFMTPALTWKGQFETMRKKMHESIVKIMNMDVNSYQASIFFNIYLIKTVYFGCGIVVLNEKQERELKRIYEEPILNKLGFSKKFPRDVLYARKSALGIGLMEPNTIIAMLKLKLYIGSKRGRGNSWESVKTQEECLMIEAGRNVPLGQNPEKRYWKATWIDEVSDELWKRQIKLIMNGADEARYTNNKTVMEYAMQYVEYFQLKIETLEQINFVRLKKGVLLPCELVGTNGRYQTSCYRNINELSPIMWNFSKQMNESINRSQTRIWKEFISWLSTQQITNNIDFDAEWRWKISEDRLVVTVEQHEGYKTYERVEQNIYVEKEQSVDTNNMNGCIGCIINGDRVQVLEVVPRLAQSNLDNESSEYSLEVLDAIVNREAVAATDASMIGNVLATHWIISTKSNDAEQQGGVNTSDWGEAMIPAGEAIGMLDLIVNVKSNTKHLSHGGLIIFNDNKKIINEINQEKTKESQYTLEAGSIVERIRREIEDAKISIEIKYSNDKPKAHINFEQQPGAELMKRCDENSKIKCSDILQEPVPSTIQHLGILTPIQNDKILDKNINVLIREVDAIKHERNIVEEKFGEFADWIDLDARNCFPGGAGVGTIKSATGYNHHGVRNKMVNAGLVSDRCPRCDDIEDWQHVVLCNSINHMKEAYLIDLEASLLKLKHGYSERETFELIIGDIRKYLWQQEEGYVTTQQEVGMKYVFRGWVVMNWINVNHRQSHVMKQANKIIARKSVEFYSKAWSNRNECFHDKDRFRSHVVEWYERIVTCINEGNRSEMKRYLRNQQLDVDKCDSSYIQLWNVSILKLMKKTKEEVVGDIRNFFPVRG